MIQKFLKKMWLMQDAYTCRQWPWKNFSRATNYLKNYVATHLLKWILKSGSFPDFIIIGFHKCGTTSLYNYIIRHPDVETALVKEPHFFSFYSLLGKYWYKAHFPSKKNKMITGEGSATYIDNFNAADRIKSMIPNSKIIILIRNPIDRAYSHYLMNIKLNKEKRNFEQIINDELKNADEVRKDWRKKKKCQYILKGIYIDEIIYWKNLFGNNLTILCSNDLLNEPQKVMNKIFAFLGLNEHTFLKYRKHNKTKYQTPIKPEIRKKLKEFYKPYNQELYQFLGKDLGWE